MSAKMAVPFTAPSQDEFQQAYGEFLARKSALEPTDIQVAGKPVSLYPLYKTVLSNGGSTKVSEGRKWKTVAAALELNTSGSALALLKKVHTTHLVEFEAEQIASGAVSPMKIEPRTASDSVPPTPTQGALTPQQSSTAMKPLYLPFKRELAAELGGYDPTLLNGDHTLGAKRIQKEEFGAIDMGQLAMHLRSGRVFEITHALNVLSVLSNDMVLEIGRVADLPVVLYQLWEQELAALPRLRPNAVEGAADIFGYDGYFYRTWDDLYALHNHASRDPTSCKVRATQRLLAITGIFRNLSFHEPNQKHFGGNAVFVGLLLDTISAQLDERGESSGSKDPHSSGDFEQLVVLELHKNVVTIVSNMGAHVKFDTPFAAGRILRFLFGFLSADPRNAALGPYMFPALEAFVRICVPYENREILGWNADLLALDAWIGKLCEYLQSAVDDFALSIPQMATLELVLMALFNLSSLSEDLRQSVSLYAGCLHSLVTITLAKPPAAANPELGLVWTTVRAKAAQVLRELARCEASHSHLRIFETNLITQLMDIAVGRMPHHSMGIPPQLAMTVELVTALHGVLYSLQIGPE